MSTSSATQTLARELKLPGAVAMGLGSILGTGIFVGIGLAAGMAGPSVVLAVAIAAVVATFNALSSAQLAAAHPVSGGTYEYGNRFLSPAVGFLAGWMFFLAKSASAATAALGFAGYLITSTGMPSVAKIPVAVVTVLLFTAVVLSGMRRSNATNLAIVSITLVALVAFIICGFRTALGSGSGEFLTPFFAGETGAERTGNLLAASALMFVAFTGYGRIATLAEEVHDPHKTIPRAIVVTLLVSAGLYILVAIAATGAVGAGFLFEATTGESAPLQLAARAMEIPGLPTLMGIGAMTAMLGVLLNLILGISRVLMAMGRRSDMPGSLATVNRRGDSPWIAVIVTGSAIGLLALFGSVKTTWSFSAFTVLVYYAITNAAAIAMPRELRLYPRWIPVAGLLSCLSLAFWVEPKVWLAGLGLGAMGMLWWWVAGAIRK